jgi:hypothetical protein
LRVVRWIVAVLLVGSAAILSIAGMLFGLRLPDPTLGRDSGCFTLLDDLLRTREPVNLLRWIEILAPIVALPAGYLVLTSHRSPRLVRTD